MRLQAVPGVVVRDSAPTETGRSEDLAGAGQSAGEPLDAIDSLSDGYYEIDRDFRYRRVNPAGLRLAQKSPVEMIGRHVLEVFPNIAQASIHETTARVMRSRVAERAETYYAPHHRWYVNSIYPIADGIAIFSRDITEEKLLEENLAFLLEASTMLAASLDYEAELERVARLTVPVLADWCVIDLLAEDGTLHRLAIVHYDPARAEFVAELKRRYPTVSPGQEHTIWKVLPAGPPWFDPEITQERFIAEARDAVHLELLRQLGFASEMILPLIARGRPLGAMTLVRAERSRRYGPRDLQLAEELARRAAMAIDNARLYQEAQQAIRLRDQFLSIAAHELRNPVTVLKGAADLLQRPAPDDANAAARRERLLEQMSRAADRLSELTNDLLDISRIQSGHLPLNLEACDLASLLTELAARYRDQLPSERQLSFNVASPYQIVADPGRIEQVLVNLLDNALKYSPQGGPIVVELSGQEGGIHIAVRDSGIGLPPDATETIFEPFGRAANTRGIPGMGLGLFICRGIVQQHHGRIWAESAGEGSGTTMHVWLPESAEARDASGANQVHRELSPATGQST